MALRIQKRSWENADGSKTHSWRLIVEVYKNGKRTDHYPDRKLYPQYGLNADDPLELALEKLEIVRAKNKNERTLERRAKIDARLSREKIRESAFLPAALYERFLEWLIDRRLWTTVPTKTESHLRCMRSLILEVNTDPADWPNKPEKVYRWFITKRLSLSYIDKVLPLLNAYGYFYCREMGKPFLEVPTPRGDIARRIEDANLNERDGKKAASLPMYPDDLDKFADLPEEKQRWLRLSVFFGLRPDEVDDLTKDKRGDTWDVKADAKGVPYLAVYQSKLVRIERRRRWKRIPCILKEQRQLVKELDKGLAIARPICRTLQARLGEGYGLYAGRKGFEKFMRERHGQKFINISRWLGHSDIRRTEQNYRELEAVEYDPPQT